jgi:hypothetical protein
MNRCITVKGLYNNSEIFYAPSSETDVMVEEAIPFVYIHSDVLL